MTQATHDVEPRADNMAFLSVAFGVLFVALSDPGGGYLSRLRRPAVVGLIGGLVTALGYGIWGRRGHYPGSWADGMASDRTTARVHQRNRDGIKTMPHGQREVSEAW